MDKLKFDSFYIFIVTLGLLLILAPFLWLSSFLNSDVQLITEEEAAGLSEYSRTVLLEKQHVIENAMRYFCFIVSICIVLGIILLVYGAYKWREIQKYNDKQIRVETERKSFELENLMSNTDVDAEIAAKIISNKESGVKNGAEINGEVIDKYRRIENLCFDYIANEYNWKSKYKIIKHIKIGLCKYDLIAKANNDSIDFLFEIRLDITDVVRLKSEIDDLRMAKSYYSESTRRAAIGFVVIVLNADGEDFGKKKEQIESLNQPADVRLKVYKLSAINEFGEKRETA